MALNLKVKPWEDETSGDPEPVIVASPNAAPRGPEEIKRLVEEAASKKPGLVTTIADIQDAVDAALTNVLDRLTSLEKSFSIIQKDIKQLLTMGTVRLAVPGGTGATTLSKVKKVIEEDVAKKEEEAELLYNQSLDQDDEVLHGTHTGRLDSSKPNLTNVPANGMTEAAAIIAKHNLTTGNELGFIKGDITIQVAPLDTAVGVPVTSEEPATKRKGRPPGSKNSVKIRVKDNIVETKVLVTNEVQALSIGEYVVNLLKSNKGSLSVLLIAELLTSDNIVPSEGRPSTELEWEDYLVEILNPIVAFNIEGVNPGRTVRIYTV